MSEPIIRTPEKCSGPITPEEKVLLEAHTKKWIANAISCEPVVPGRLVSAIEGLYEAAGKDRPTVVVVTSPVVMAFAGGFAAAIVWDRDNNKKTKKTKTPVFSEVGTDCVVLSETVRATYAAAGLDAPFKASTVRREVTGQDFVELAKKMGKSIGVDWKFMIECAKNWSRMYQGGNMWSYYDCYLTAFRDVLGLRLPEHKKYAAWERCALEGGFRIMHEKFCIVSDRPEILKIDDQNRPHAESGPSHRWRDGFSMYHWHGVRVPSGWLSGQKPSAKQALTWDNIEQRRAACEIVGWANILKELKAKVIDKHENPEIGTLLEVDLPDSGKERFLSVKCGTGRDFCIPVPREMRSATQANAWSYGLDPAEFAPEVRT